MEKTEFNHGAVHEFLVTFATAGGTEADLTRLTKSRSQCTQVISFLHGTSEIRPKRRLINLAADPFCPNGRKVEEHVKTKPWKFDAKQIRLSLNPNQVGGRTMLGHDLRKALEGKPVLNANVLDWLLKEENQHLIPEEWKGKAIFFWGTIYHDSDDNLYVRYLYWNDGQWSCFSLCLDSLWDERSPTASLSA